VTVSFGLGLRRRHNANVDPLAERVVVVDDLADAAEVLAQTLRYEGYDVRTAADGVMALEVVARHVPLCVLMDVDMPRMDGFELARRLREIYGSDMVLIAVTGWGDSGDHAGARYACFDHCLSKPVDLEKLRTILRPT